MNLLDVLCQKLDTSLDRSGRAHADCPFCGHPRTRGSYHFYFYDATFGQGYRCWSCGARGGLTDLAAHLDLHGYTPPVARPQEPPPPAPWSQEQALNTYRATQAKRWPQVVAAWQAYKPLSEATIRAADLGLGRLPLWSEQRREWYGYRFDRLILPIMANGQIVGLRGRAIYPDDTGPKWLTASFSETVLMGLERVQRGATVVWCENLIDRLLAAQIEPSAVYVAAGGVSWRNEWLDTLAERRPASVLIWFDNDLAGCPNAATRRAALARRQAEGKPVPPEPRGPRLANELLARGVPARIYDWPHGSAEHADLGGVLTAYLHQQEAA